MAELMRSILAGLALAGFVLVAPGKAEAPLSAADQASIRGVITEQIEAFKADDGIAAFAYASPMIQQLFGTPERFMEMVKSGYLPVYRPREVAFLDVVEIEGDLVQRVLVVGPDQRAVRAYYSMQRQQDGTWRINGCTLEQLPEVAI
jgi:Domain of unknown function (DUF4864)